MKSFFKHITKKIYLAILLMLLASLSLALSGLFVKLADPFYSTNFIICLKSAINFATMITYICFFSGRKFQLRNIKTKNLSLQIFRALCGLGTVYFLYYGIKLYSYPKSVLLVFSYPIFVPLAARIILKTPIVPKLWIGIAISFCGVVLVVGGGNIFNVLAFIPLIGSLSAATGTVALKKLHGYDSWEVTTIYFFGLSFLISFFIVVVFGPIPQRIIFLPFLFALLAGIVSTIYQVLLSISSTMAPIRLLSPIVFISFVFSDIINYLIFDMNLGLYLILAFSLL